MTSPLPDAAAAAPEADTAESFTQADVDRIVADRLKREREKVGDVRALKAAAEELASIKESQKSDAQKQADRIAALEAETRAARIDALRFQVAASNGITGEDAELFLTGQDEETLTKQAARLVERNKPGTPKPDPSQGARGNASPQTTGDLFAAAIEGSFTR